MLNAARAQGRPTMVIAMTTAATSQPKAIHAPPKKMQRTFRSSDTGCMRAPAVREADAIYQCSGPRATGFAATGPELGSCSRLLGRYAEQSFDVGGRLRRAEQVTLHLGAAEPAQQLALRLGLDAFGRRRHVERGGNVHHGLHDRRGTVGFGNVADKAAVDLDLVEREALQIAERGIAGAEIVERDAYPDRTQLMQDRKGGLIVADQNRFGDLDLQSVRLQGGGGQCCRDPQRQRGAFQLNW